MGVALYRKYRSRSLSEVVGQDHVTRLLANAIKADKVAHAYLFTGPRGVGKTSIARIMAHEINGLDYTDESVHLDIIEIDAASNNGVEDIRDLRDRVQIAPVSAKRKVYIIDEVHMLSKQAFNALLKTLEEPPEHVVFILATTDIDKVPETIQSRTQRHSFRRASEADIVTNLKRIAKHESVTVDEPALQLVAKHSDGSFRDSVSLFDQLVSGTDSKNVSVDAVTQSLGLVPEDAILALLKSVDAGDIAAIDTQLMRLESSGIPPRTTATQLVDRLRRELRTQPQYASLLDSLLDISRSHYPELKLLTVLSLHNLPTVAARALPAPEPEPETVASPAINKEPSISPKPSPQASDTSEKEAAPEKKIVKRPATVSASEFDWAALLAHVKSHHVALHSVLSKCEPEVDGSTLRLYTKSAFYKKKLDDTKYRVLIASSLSELGYNLEAKTVATAKPLKDSQAARVAAIMGGGEEVSVENA